MKDLFWLLIFIICSATVNAQKITGYVYNTEGIIPNFKVENISKGFYVETNAEGKFLISANLGDTISFRSIAYNSYKFMVKNSHFEEEIVVELTTNSLEEVKLSGGKSFKVPVEQLDDQLLKGIRSDIAKNPLAYRPGYGNLLEAPLYLAKLIFPKKKKTEIAHKVEYNLRFEHFKAFFKEDDLINEEFLMNELLIPKKYHVLFFNFLETENYTSALLGKDLKLEMISRLQESAKEYRQEVLSKQ
ncbi:hypothetical protein SAMN04487907_102252 [Zunongwangia mangrovi]|uniref:CarboxypepD_reg-like domain-containing protein n=1 Tax=Zunongwangia mangrovi TaxID=1334022 RepID=A0A1I1GF29_9FLAO|nr:hypothetical protein [Zunongwangia mangrovi]SFC10349.1 hypothetical protein SAMN04487907_102252 [Zunongwangia mangrovi]